MAEENTTPAAAPESQDTRTRKTVRLRSAGVPPQTQDTVIADPLAGRDTDTGNLEIIEDTQTRKTLKLKPMAPGAGAVPKLNLGGNDTNTRKTVVLRPSAPPSASVLPKTVLLKEDDIAAAKAEAENKAADPDTAVHTAALPRQTATSSPKISLTPPGAAPKTAPASPPGATVTLSKADVKEATAASSPKISLTPPGAAPKTAPGAAAPKAEVSDQTAAVPKPVTSVSASPLASAQGDSDDQTVKMKRPPRLVPSPRPAGTTNLRPPTVGAVPKNDSNSGDEDIKATVKLPARPGTPGTGMPPKPVTPAVPKPSTMTAAVKPVEAAAAAPVVPQPEAPKAEAPKAEAPKAEAPKTAANDDLDIALAPSKRAKADAGESEGAQNQKAKAPKDKSAVVKRKRNGEDEENSPSVFYLIVAVASLVLIAGAATISAVHYLDFDHGLKYYDKVPGLPMAK
ncbi:MAG: hypothetical protein IKA87_03205 [Lentisphaeria bacterium]|nr:hypothetical protein [Lentisphaeria bacterium]